MSDFELNKRYKAVILDLDGTLLDTTAGVVFAVEKTIVERKLPMPDNVTLKTFVGPPMQLSFQKHFGLSEEEALIAANDFRTNYKSHSLLRAELYPGVIEALEELKRRGYKLAVATNKSHENAMAILEHFGVAQLCDFAMGSDLAGKLKKADIIVRCLAGLGVEPEKAVYVGDSVFDLEGATSVGMDFIGATYGFGFDAREDIGWPSVDRFPVILNLV